MNDLLIAAILCASLGSPHHATRHAATVALERMGERALPTLTLHANSSSPEVRHRASSLLARHAPVDELEMLLARHWPLPIIEAAPDETPWKCTIVNSYFWKAFKTTKNHDDTSTATALWIRDMAAQGVPLDCLDCLLVRMKARMAGRPNVWFAGTPPDSGQWLDVLLVRGMRWAQGYEALCFPADTP